MRYFSLSTKVLAAYIILSASFILQIRKFLINIFGAESIKIIFFTAFISLAAYYLFYISRKTLPVLKITLTVFIFVAAYVVSSKQPYFAEKFHIIEYGILGYLSLKDTLATKKSLRDGIMLASVFVFLIGIIDEAFQKILPYRVGEIRDVITNMISGSLGVLQYFIYEKMKV